jgi:hypothetical protein
MKRECANTTHISIQYQYYEVKVKIIIDYFHVLELQEVKLQRILQKISQSLSGSEHFCGSIQLDVIRVITSRLEVKTFFGTLHQRQALSRIPALNLDFPLTAANGIAKRERERKPTYNTETKCAKLERLRSARLIRRDPKATNSRHAKLQVK